MNKKKIIMGTSTLLLAIAGIIVGFSMASKPDAIILQGQMEAEEIDVAPKVAGRIAEVYVKEGQQISIGTPIMRFDSPEIDAKVAQANAAHDAAQAQADKAQSGARPQEIEMAKQTYFRAQAAADLAQKTYDRVNKLASEGLLSKQKRDEAYANYTASRDQALAAKAQYNMAQEGARKEDIAAADAMARQYGAVVKEAQVAEDEAKLKSPVMGEVSNIIAKVGQINPQGVPAISVVNLKDQWVVLNVREDQISRFAIGAQFKGELPALGKNGQKAIATFKVYASSPLADFATWRSTRNNQGFDLKTFEVKARPIVPIEHMRPGMSVLVTL